MRTLFALSYFAVLVFCAERMEGRIKNSMNTIKAPSDKNPTASFWKAFSTFLKEGNRPVAKLRMLSQEFERRAQNHLMSQARELAAVLHDEQFKTASGGTQVQKDTSLEIVQNAEVLEAALDFAQYSKAFEAGGTREGGDDREQREEQNKQKQELQIKSIASSTSGVLAVLDALFVLTERLPDTEGLLRQVVPLVDDILELGRFAKLDLSKDIKEMFEKLTAAYDTAFGPYKRPFYQRGIFKYGLTMSAVFLGSLSLALWILLRRPTIKAKKN